MSSHILLSLEEMVRCLAGWHNGPLVGNHCRPLHLFPSTRWGMRRKKECHNVMVPPPLLFWMWGFSSTEASFIVLWLAKLNIFSFLSSSFHSLCLKAHSIFLLNKAEYVYSTPGFFLYLASFLQIFSLCSMYIAMSYDNIRKLYFSPNLEYISKSGPIHCGQSVGGSQYVQRENFGEWEQSAAAFDSK